jgi:signal transduction histidine kinase
MHTLRSRLILFTTMLLVISCSVLSWYFIARQIDSATDSLLQKGNQLASHLALVARHSITVKDTRRIQELIAGVFIQDEMSYLFVTSQDNQVLGAIGAPAWKHLPRDRMELDWLPLLHAKRDEAIRQPQVPTTVRSSIHIVDGRPVTETSVLFSIQRWGAVLLGIDRPLLYDIVVPVISIRSSRELDPAVDLLSESDLSTPAIPSDRSAPLAGLVQIGLTDRQQQTLLRELVWQGIIATVVIIAMGIGAVVYIARRMTGPLNELISAARHIRDGNLSNSVAPKTSDEIGELADVFNQMTDSLRSHEIEVAESARLLETKVAERTRELQQANVRLQELDQVKTALVSNASHELRTPLTSIKVHVTNLLDGVTGALAPRQIENLNRVHANVERLRSLIDDLLDLSRLQTGYDTMKLEDVLITDLAHEVLHSLEWLSGEKRLSITVAFPPSFPRIAADREKLRRVLTNLLHNSIKFTPDGGHIRIGGQQHASDAITLTVEDSGCGIAAEELNKVFLPFYRSSALASRPPGSGLGLAITKELVELHHGTIWVESLVGQGSRFHIRIPILFSHETIGEAKSTHPSRM